MGVKRIVVHVGRVALSGMHVRPDRFRQEFSVELERILAQPENAARLGGMQSEPAVRTRCEVRPAVAGIAQSIVRGILK